MLKELFDILTLIGFLAQLDEKIDTAFMCLRLA